MGIGQLAGIPNWLKNKIKKIEVSLTDIAIPLLLLDWIAQEDGTYTQVVTVDGLSADSVPVVALSSVNDIASEDELNSYACIKDIVTAENQITFIASELPPISFTVVAKGVAAAQNDVTSDITALVDRVSKLETKKYGVLVRNYGTGHNSNAEYIEICKYTVTEKGLYSAESYAGGYNYLGEEKRVIVRVNKTGAFTENFHSEEIVKVNEHFGVQASSLFDCEVGDIIICYLYTSKADTNTGNIYHGKIMRVM